MKRNLLKSVCFVMSVVLLLLSNAIGSFAVDGVKTDIPQLNGWTPYQVVPNSSESAVVFTFMDDFGDITLCGVTKDGTSFEMLDFSEYTLQGSNCYSINDVKVKGDKYIFVVVSYNVKQFLVDVSDEYDREYTEIGTSFVITEDFENFSSKTLNVKNDQIMSLENGYSYYGMFENIGDTWIYFDGDYVITRETAEGYHGKTVYYTTKDFVNWKICYAPEYLVVEDDGELYSYFSIAGDYLVIENHKMFYEYDVVSSVSHSTDVTKDFSNYSNIHKLGISKDINEACYYSPQDGSNYFYKIECVYKNGLDIGYENYILRVVRIDLSTGVRSILKEIEEEYTYWGTAQLGDTSYFIAEDFVQLADVNYFERDGKYKRINIEWEEYPDYTLTIGERIYAFENGTMWIVEDTDARKYDVSDIVNSDNSLFTVPFTLNHKLFIFQFADEKAVIYAIDAEVGKLGDVNLDNKFSSSDALSTLQCATGIIPLDDDGVYRADVNKDDKVNSSDALFILQRSTGIISQF